MNIYIKVFYISVFYILYLQNIDAQVFLDNASFEGKPADATMPSGWMLASEGTTPDILPGFWGVYIPPSNGDTYIGLITRPDGSFESIQQRLPTALNQGKCYEITIDLANSDTYAGYSNGLHLKIWLGSYKNDRGQLIYKSEKIKHQNWQTYPIHFTPDNDYYYIIIEAHISDQPVNYEGNILLDNLSPVRDCNKA